MNKLSMFAGVDEAGRGPLAGPVVAAAVILDRDKPIIGLTDSKKLSQMRRSELEKEIKQSALHWTVARASVGEIDKLNILQATLLAMQRAINLLPVYPTATLIDGPHLPKLAGAACAVVGGDGWVNEISAASILAKQERDRQMIKLDKKFPQYGFARHKGYPTKLHIAALNEYGICMHHRKSYAPVKLAMQKFATTTVTAN